MADIKPTQEQIIKGLERCCSNEFQYSDERCTECQYHEADKERFCFEVLENDALDLIKRLKTRIVRYQLKNTNQRNALASLNKKVAEQKAEIERLQEELKITRAAVHNNGLEWGLISIKKLVDDTKTEAIKEFAERLKCRIREYIFISELEFQCEEVDNLVKEMTEG